MTLRNEHSVRLTRVTADLVDRRLSHVNARAAPDLDVLAAI
jgi:hypothetical protein